MVNYVCVKTVPDSTKVRLIKGPKPKFPGGECPWIPLVCHMLCTQIHTYPRNNSHNLILPPLGKKKETLSTILDLCKCTVANRI